MTAFRDSARIFRIADIIGYIEVFCNFSVVDCDLLQLQQRLLLPYLWETTNAWSLTEAAPVSKCFRCETAFSFPRWLVRLVTLYISDERWAEIALRDWEIASLSQSVELRQAASSQIVHLKINKFHLYYLFTNK